MDLDNQRQEGNPPESLPQRQQISRRQRHHLNKKLREQQAQRNEAQNNQPQGNQPQSNQPVGKNHARNQRQRQRKRLQRQQVENSKLRNDLPQLSHTQQNLPQDGQHQNSQSQHNQPQDSQRQNKSPQGNERRNDQPLTKVLKEPPAWFGRVSQYHAKESADLWGPTLDQVFQEGDDLSDWECNCGKKPDNCKCKQTQVILQGEKAFLNEEFLKYQEQRNDLKRAVRIEAYEEEEDKMELVNEEKEKVSEIRAAITEIKRLQAPNARTSIGIRGCVFDLHCVELYELSEIAGDGEGSEIAFFEDWETEEGSGEFGTPRPPLHPQFYGPSGYTPGRKILAFVTLNDIVYGDDAWCSNPFPGPEHAARYILGRYGYRTNQGQSMDITFHNNDYLELKVSAKTVIGLCDGNIEAMEKFRNYFKDTKDQKKNQYFHFYGVRRKGTSGESSEEGSQEGSEEGSNDESNDGSEEGSED